MHGWRGALFWGITVALVQRLVLVIWLPVVWGIIGGGLNGGNPDFHTHFAPIPALETTSDQQIFGVWRRWDAIHYFDLATNGYRLDNPGASVFGVVTPVGLQLTDAILPGSLDLAAMVFETAMFALALIFLYRLCETYYADSALAPYAVITMALLPLSFFFAAPMSEAPYLAFILAFFYFCTNGRWGIAAIAGVLATLTRNQAVLLIFPAFILLFQALWKRDSRLTDNVLHMLKRGWVFGLLPLTYFAFDAWRRSLGFPSLSETYSAYSYIYFTNPLDGLLINVRFFLSQPLQALGYLDIWMMALVLILAPISLVFRLHRRLPLQVYTWSYLLLYFSKVNWYYNTNDVYYTQSFGRYALTLFPLWVMMADGIRRAHPIIRLLCIAGLVLVLLFTSGLYVIALAGP